MLRIGLSFRAKVGTIFFTQNVPQLAGCLSREYPTSLQTTQSKSAGKRDAWSPDTQPRLSRTVTIYKKNRQCQNTFPIICLLLLLLFRFYVCWAQKFTWCHVLWPNRGKMQLFFSANKVQSQTNRDWPTWLFPLFSRAASFCFKFWLVCYIICRHRDWQWSLNVTVLASQQQLEKHYIDKLTAHSRVEYNTHLSCKFSSFSYRPALLQQLTAFGICAASVINSYKNSEAQVTH